MYYRAVAPVGTKPLQVIRVNVARGQELKVQIPKGTKPGETFYFAVDASASDHNAVITLCLPESSLTNTSTAAAGTTKSSTSNPHAAIVVDSLDLLLLLLALIHLALAFCAGYVAGVLFSTENIYAHQR